MDELTSSQLSEWEAYDKIDPVGTWRSDFRMAFLATVITNLAISIHGKKGTKPVEIIDLMPIWDQEIARMPKTQTVEQMKAIFKDIVASQKRTQKRKNILDNQSKKPPVKKK